MGWNKIGSGVLAAGFALSVLVAGFSAQPISVEEGGPGFKSISEEDVETRLEFLANPGMEGRDTPSEGQTRAAAYLVQLYEEFGLEFAPDSLEVMGDFGGDGPGSGDGKGSFYRPFMHEGDAPDEEGCQLSFSGGKTDASFEYGKDFVPVHRAGGAVSGELVFGGFGIDSSSDKYNDYKSVKIKDKVVLLFSGEPRHKKKFEGEEVTSSASLWSKQLILNKAGAAGALIVRRDPVGAEGDENNGLDFRYSYASWNDAGTDRGPRRAPSKSLPTLEISMDCASALLGTDAQKLAEKMDKSAKPTKVKLKGVRIDMASGTTRREVRHDNIMGVLRGTDPELTREYVLLGAHFDHIGVGPAGRVGCGANDNGSGVAAFLEVAEALSQGAPRRSVIFANFCGEEDGLVGAREIAKRLPVDQSQIICMINLDQIGFGATAETSVLGINRNPKLEKVLDRAKRLDKTGLRKVITGKGEDLWQRSDHFAFHSIGLPVMFFFEGLPISKNKDYHTWRDTVDKVNIPKVTNTARMVYNTIWILANDDDRPPEPRD
ncbi:MAG: hypothetical protein ACI8X5_002303 [Planctomycetota bacterium]|jgi:hypothetical protein